LLGGTRLPKNHIRIEAYGTLDELNSYMGLLGDQEINQKRLELIREIQETLFTMGSHLASEPGKTAFPLPEIDESLTNTLEEEMDKMDKELPEMKNFILPGGHPSVSFTHIARCICRRAERQVISLAENEKVPPSIGIFLNRLSDYLFVLARMTALELKSEEIPWKPRG
jgi:cob(I)alamin adenosyltransferase